MLRIFAALGTPSRHHMRGTEQRRGSAASAVDIAAYLHRRCRFDCRSRRRWAINYRLLGVALSGFIVCACASHARTRASCFVFFTLSCARHQHAPRTRRLAAAAQRNILLRAPRANLYKKKTCGQPVGIWRKSMWRHQPAWRSHHVT